jgi:hypothetical protein
MPQEVPYDLGPFETRAEAQETCDQITQWGGICAVVERPNGFFVRVTKEPGAASVC